MLKKTKEKQANKEKGLYLLYQSFRKWRYFYQNNFIAIGKSLCKNNRIDTEFLLKMTENPYLLGILLFVLLSLISGFVFASNTSNYYFLHMLSILSLFFTLSLISSVVYRNIISRIRKIHFTAMHLVPDSRSVKLSDEYMKNGYKIVQDPISRAHYAMSNKVNLVLYEDRWHRYITHGGPFKLPKQCLAIASFYLLEQFKKCKMNGVPIFCGDLAGIADDITVAEEDRYLRMKKTNYFNYLLTNNITNHAYYAAGGQGWEKFDGSSLLYTKDGCLRELKESSCSNHLGGPSLVVTKDGYLILQIQSAHHNNSAGMLVPSAAGATDYADFLETTASAKDPYKERATFQDLVENTVYREFLEENGISKKNDHNLRTRLKTRVIGFARLLERGGKPDFYCVSFIDLKAADIYPQLKDDKSGIKIIAPNGCTDKEIYRHVLIPDKAGERKTDVILRAIREPDSPLSEYGLSRTLSMLIYIINNYYDSGIDVFESLKIEPAFVSASGMCVPPTGDDGFGISKAHGFAYVIDGATSLWKGDPSKCFSARDFTNSLKVELDKRLSDRSKDLKTILIDAVCSIRENNLIAKEVFLSSKKDKENEGPSAAITIVRLNNNKIEYFSLGDCPLSIQYKDGRVEVITNADLASLDRRVLEHMQEIARKESTTVRNARKHKDISDHLIHNRNLKNKEGGYWILDLSGDGIRHGSCRSFYADTIESVVLMSDGISDLYNCPHRLHGRTLSKSQVHYWLMNDSEGAMEYLKREYEKDLEWEKYPRFKAIDDITIISARLQEAEDVLPIDETA